MTWHWKEPPHQHHNLMLNSIKCDTVWTKASYAATSERYRRRGFLCQTLSIRSRDAFLFYDLSDAHLEALKENWCLSPPVREGCTSSSCLTPTLPAACVCYLSPYLSPYVSAGCMVRQQPQIVLRFQRIPTLCLDFVIFSAAALKKVQYKPISSPPSAGGNMQTHAAHLNHATKNTGL